MLKTPKLFISYSRPDESYKNELERALATMKRNGEIDPWNDREIVPGEEWDKQINTELLNADIILLLVSADFLASRYCNDVDVSAAMTKHGLNEARVIPVIIRPCDWNASLFGKLQALPTDGKPVNAWADKDMAYLNIVQGIRKATGSVNNAKQHGNFLEEYPVYPMVEPEDVPLHLIQTISKTVRRAEAEAMISEANRLRKSINPNDQTATVIQFYNLPDPYHTSPFDFWINAIGEARLHGPRMLASLLLTIPDYQFPEQAKQEKTALLEKLKSYNQ